MMKRATIFTMSLLVSFSLANAEPNATDPNATKPSSFKRVGTTNLFVGDGEKSFEMSEATLSDLNTTGVTDPIKISAGKDDSVDGYSLVIHDFKNEGNATVKNLSDVVAADANKSATNNKLNLKDSNISKTINISTAVTNQPNATASGNEMMITNTNITAASNINVVKLSDGSSAKDSTLMIDTLTDGTAFKYNAVLATTDAKIENTKIDLRDSRLTNIIGVEATSATVNGVKFDVLNSSIDSFTGVKVDDGSVDGVSINLKDSKIKKIVGVDSQNANVKNANMAIEGDMTTDEDIVVTNSTKDVENSSITIANSKITLNGSKSILLNGENANVSNSKIFVKNSKITGNIKGQTVTKSLDNSIVVDSSKIDGEISGWESPEQDSSSNIMLKADSGDLTITKNVSLNTQNNKLSLINQNNKAFKVDGMLKGSTNAGAKNTLDVKGKGIALKGIENFDTINISLPTKLKADEAVLTLTDNTNLSTSKLNLDVDKESIDPTTNQGYLDMDLDDKFEIIKANSGLTLPNEEDIKLKRELLVDKNIYLYSTKLNKEASSLNLTVNKNSKKIHPRVKHAFVPNLSSIHLIDKMSDNLAANISGIDYMIGNELDEKDVATFGYLNGFKSKYANENLELKGGILTTGVAGKSQSTLFGGYFQLASAKYDSKILSDVNDFGAKGDMMAYGIGAFARTKFNTNLFMDIDAKIGLLKSGYDFKFEDGKKFNNKKTSNYYGAGIYVGYGDLLSGGSVVYNARVGYTYSYLAKSDLTIDSQKVNIDSISSSRIKFDSVVSLNRANIAPYVNLKLVYDLDKRKNPTPYNQRLKRAVTDLDGNGGLSYGCDLGVKLYFSKNSEVSVIAGAMAGKTKELDGKIRAIYRF